MTISFRLLEISNYGWNGISICDIETLEDTYSLLHIERTEGIWKFELLFFIKFII
jgi:hypothetical protein